MKILLISPTEEGIGGVAQHVHGLSQFLTTQNHKVDTISSKNTFTIPVKGLKNPSFMLSAFLRPFTGIVKVFFEDMVSTL